MDLFEAISKRHSYRGEFTDAAVPRKDLEKIAQAGIQAPSGKNEQVVTFVIVDEPRLLKQIAEIVDNRPVCRSAKAMIVCVIDPRAVMGGVSFGVEDCAAAVENMLLAITALGYAGVWLDGALRTEDRAVRVGQLLGVPTERRVRVLLPLGVPAQPGHQRERRPFYRRAWFNCHGETG
jgi:nitroreductase